jgi:hypothetical protein
VFVVARPWHGGWRADPDMAPDVAHWHGAAPDQPLVQINIGFGGGAKWAAGANASVNTTLLPAVATFLIFLVGKHLYSFRAVHPGLPFPAVRYAHCYTPRPDESDEILRFARG